MRYAIASLFSLLIIGMASGVPDDPTTPVGRPVGTPGSAACMVSPEPQVSDIEYTAESASALQATRDARRADLERSMLPNEEQVAEAKATQRNNMACMSNGEADQILALHTENGRRAAYAARGSSPSPHQENREQALNPPGLAAGRIALLWSGEPRLLPDARLAVPIITRQGADPETWSVLVLARQDGRYLIDAVATLEPRSRAWLFPAPAPNG
jgi:hypothetical protein